MAQSRRGTSKRPFRLRCRLVDSHHRLPRLGVPTPSTPPISSLNVAIRRPRQPQGRSRSMGLDIQARSPSSVLRAPGDLPGAGHERLGRLRGGPENSGPAPGPLSWPVSPRGTAIFVSVAAWEPGSPASSECLTLVVSMARIAPGANRSCQSMSGPDQRIADRLRPSGGRRPLAGAAKVADRRDITAAGMAIALGLLTRMTPRRPPR